MDQFIIEITGAGGVMIIAIGLRLLGILNIRVANLLPHDEHLLDGGDRHACPYRRCWKCIWKI